ncbi:MAPEG family protein [Sphingomonas sp. C8-2]|jgi:hypothetical protein|uniref:hypothetical protein n=1 Tax=Sphingomonas sp. KC8 TaxID=1030157 RepID=UPI0002489422|nr:hypothetical protein [Sphingomonas sp. KC8]ARS26440.1 ribosomal protein L11 [Sphingomonas sp. KC8]QEH78413.1 MAPEG family protein [Sphingomonas sp. C8-2]
MVEGLHPTSPGAPTDLKQEQRVILRNSMAGLVFCVLVLAVAWWLVPTLFRLPGGDIASLATFWSGSALLTMFWVLVGFSMVSRGRRHSLDDIRGSAFASPTPSIAIFVAFLQNTIEQTLMAVVVPIAVLLLAGAWTVPLVAGQVLLFAIGRVTFLMGYRKGAGGRAFGLAVTALPTLAGFLLALGALVGGVLASVT